MFICNEQKSEASKVSLTNKRRTDKFFAGRHRKKHRKIQKTIKTKDKQLAETKKILQGAKNSYQGLTKENKQLRQYIANIKQQEQQQLEQQQQQK